MKTNEEIKGLIKNSSPLIARVDLIDIFTCSEEEYMKIRRKELKRKALFRKAIVLHPFLDYLYPFSKPLMEKLWGAVYIH